MEVGRDQVLVDVVSLYKVGTHIEHMIQEWNRRFCVALA